MRRLVLLTLLLVLPLSAIAAVNVTSGNLSHRQPLFAAVGGSLPLGVSLVYNSRDGHVGELGKGWSHSYQIYLDERSDGSVMLSGGIGRRLYYPDGNGGYRPRTGDHSALEREVDGTWTITLQTGLQYHFGADRQLAAMLDRNDNRLDIDHSVPGRTTITDAAMRQAVIHYGSNGKIDWIEDPAQQRYDFLYNAGGLLWQVQYPEPVPGAGRPGWEYSYTPQGLLESRKDPEGYMSRYAYDHSQRVVSIVDPEGSEQTVQYASPAAEEVTVTGKDGGVWIYQFTPEKQLTSKTDPEGNSTSYTYDASHNTLSKTDATGITAYSYDASGNMTSTTDPLGQTTSYTYNTFGQATSITDAEGSVTRYEYDAKGNLTKTTDPTGAATSYGYDVAGRVASVTDVAGGVTRMGYDVQGNLAFVTDPSSATQRMEYDAYGRMIKQIDPQGGVTTFEYDARGNLIKIVDPIGNVTTSTFDANGNKTSEIDANGNTTRYEYNAQGQMVKMIDALGNVTTFAYGGAGCASCGGGADNLTSLTDAKGQTTIFEYDTLGRLIRETDPIGNGTTYSYDAKGNLTAKTDANGNTICYSYDGLGRLVRKNYPDGSEEVYSYDGKGNILTAANSAASYSFTYDVGGKVTSVTDANGRVLQYTYDAAGRKSQTTYPDGSIVSQSYDTAGRLKEIRNGGGRTCSFGYDPLGRRSTLAFPNGVVATYTYDNGGRLTSLTHKNAAGEVLAMSAYTLDKIGNRLSRTDTRATASYAYDKIYRLLEAVSSTPGNSDNASGKGKGISAATQQQKEFYTYDPAGNRLSSERTATYTYNAANQLLSNGGSYSYDKNGNLIRKTTDEGTTTYTWDYDNRLTKVTLPNGTVAEYAYDPFGRRVEKRGVTENGSTSITRYVYDNEDIILEYDGNGAIGNKYVHGPGIDEPLALTTDKETYFYHADGLGSIVALTDKSGKVVQTYEYDSFGHLKDLKNKVKQPFGFTSREYDREIGLYYYRARYFDQLSGRFISKDPIAIGGNIYTQGVNVTFSQYVSAVTKPYTYTGNDPINFIDPFGLFEVFGQDININVEGGYQAGIQAVLVGLNGSLGGVVGTDGQRCGLATICFRLGPGIYAGGGLYGAVGGTRGNTSNVEGWTVGGGGDAGWGPSVGGQGVIGPTNASIAGPISKVKGGGGWGANAGIDFCYTFTFSCSECPDK